MSLDYDDILDVRGLNCPLPILKTKKQLVGLEKGQVLYVQATDPHSVIDFTAFCDKTGNELVERWEADAVFHFLLRKGGR